MMRRLWGRVSPRFVGVLSSAALLVLMGLEGFSATPYQDQAKVWTDGYGNTEHVVPGKKVTEPQARATLVKHVDVFSKGIEACLSGPVTQNQFDAYILMTYNIGVTAFCNSSTVRLHNEGEYARACDAMLKWNKITVHGQLVYNKGLDNRRHKERDLCLLP